MSSRMSESNGCPVGHAQNVESGSPVGLQSHGPGLGDFQIQLLSALLALTQEVRQQTLAINRLAESNQALVQPMSEGEDMDPDAMPTAYLDGSPIR